MTGPRIEFLQIVYQTHIHMVLAKHFSRFATLERWVGDTPGRDLLISVRITWTAVFAACRLRPVVVSRATNCKGSDDYISSALGCAICLAILWTFEIPESYMLRSRPAPAHNPDSQKIDPLRVLDTAAVSCRYSSLGFNSGRMWFGCWYPRTLPCVVGYTH